MPWGLPGLSDKDQQQLEAGNKITKAALEIIRCLERFSVPYIIENPLTSILWWLPQIKRIAAREHVHFRTDDFCQCGTMWKKPTMFLCT